MVAAAAAFIVQTAAGRAIRILSAEQTEGFKIIAEEMIASYEKIAALEKKLEKW